MPTPLHLVHVLVVDDDDVQRILLPEMLRQIGINNCDVAASGDEALAKLQRELFHVVLTDKTMPGMDGTCLIENIRLNPLINHLRIAMISSEISSKGYADITPEEAALRSFLWQKSVLALPKEGLGSASLARALSTLVGD